ncbi:motility protein A [Dethiothermospora halolimnae]|uniref:motility protein A n=1 Tax=Dethiothermospora halolimnae TaxID=3114390 RepID=UPI003CCBD09A
MKYRVPIITILIILLIHSVIGSISFEDFINLQAFELIIAGIFLSIIISYPFDTLMFSVKLVKESFKNNIAYEDSIMKIYNYAVRMKRKGIIGCQGDIEKELDQFIKNGMTLICDYEKAEDIEIVLNKEIQAKEVNLYRPYNVVKMIAQVAPAFGLIGTLIGMVGLLSHINNPDFIASNMSTALVSTLYGALISNFVAVPLMGRLKDFIDRKMLLYKIVTEGIILIAKNDSTRNVFDKMNSMLMEDEKLEYPIKTNVKKESNVYELT